MSLINTASVAEMVLSHEIFNDSDKNEMIERYDLSRYIVDMSSVTNSEGLTRQTDNIISSIPKGGLIISDPGNYTFSGDLIWKPEALTGAAIIINSFNVAIDMKGFSLIAEIEDDSAFYAGIYICDTFNINISNGTLQNMGYYGIVADNVNSLNIENIRIDGSRFTNLNKRNLCPSGIHVGNAYDLKITKCVVMNMEVTADSSAGIQIINTARGAVTDCIISTLVNNDGSVQGYSYIGTIDIMTTGSVAEDLRSFFNGNVFTMGHTVIGFIPIFSSDLGFENCAASTLTGCSDDCHGMSIFLNANVEVNRFIAENIIDGAAPENEGAKATGLEVYGIGILVTNSISRNIMAIRPQDKQSAGFSAWGALILFENCTADNVKVVDENFKKDSKFGNGTGFGWAPDPRVMFRNTGASNVEYNSCKALDCDVGFDTWYHIKSVWKDIQCIGCDVNILVEPEGKRTISCNEASECYPPITVTLENIARDNDYPDI